MRVGGVFTRWRSATSAVLLGVGVLSSSSVAVAKDPTKDQCADAYESTQRLERASKLIAALDAATICANAACPEVLRVDCVAWLSPLRARQSSLVVEARDGRGHELFEVTVRVDEGVAQDHLDGRAFFVDPGKHRLTFEASGWPSEQRDVVVREGEQGRKLLVTFGAEKRIAEAPSPFDAPVVKPSSGLPVSSWIVGGVGLAALGVFTGFAISGKSLEGNLENECAPRCDPNRVSSVRDQYVVADISLGVGLVSLGVATWIALASRH